MRRGCRGKKWGVRRKRWGRSRRSDLCYRCGCGCGCGWGWGSSGRDSDVSVAVVGTVIGAVGTVVGAVCLAVGLHCTTVNPAWTWCWLYRLLRHCVGGSFARCPYVDGDWGWWTWWLIPGVPATNCRPSVAEDCCCYFVLVVLVAGGHDRHCMVAQGQEQSSRGCIGKATKQKSDEPVQSIWPTLYEFLPFDDFPPKVVRRT